MNLRNAIGLPEAAERYSVSTTTVRRWVDRGLFPLPVILPGGTWRFTESDLEKFDAWLDAGAVARKIGAAPPTVPTWYALEEPTPAAETVED